jgi:hypothetical protein
MGAGRPNRFTADPAKTLQSRTRPVSTAQASDSDSDAEAWSRAASRPQPASVRAPPTATILASRRETGGLSSVRPVPVQAMARVVESEDSDNDMWKAAAAAGPSAKAVRATLAKAPGAVAARPSAPQAQPEVEDSDDDMWAAAAVPQPLRSRRITETAARRETGPPRQEARTPAASSASSLLPWRHTALREVSAVKRPARPEAFSSPLQPATRRSAGTLPSADSRATATAAAAAAAEGDSSLLARRRATTAAGPEVTSRPLRPRPARGDTFPPSAKPPPPPDRRATAAAAPAEDRLSLLRAIAARGSFDPLSTEPSPPAGRFTTEAAIPSSQLPPAARPWLAQHGWTAPQLSTHAQMPEHTGGSLPRGYDPAGCKPKCPSG